MEKNKSLTTLSVTGSMQVPNDLVSFSLSFQKESKSYDDALKQEFLKMQESFDKVLEDLRVNDKFALKKGSLKKNLSNRDNWKQFKNKWVRDGVVVTQTITFSSKSVDLASKVFDECSKLGFVVNQPTFSVKDISKYNKKCLEKAKNTLETRLDEQCEVLGLVRNDLEMTSYRVEYQDEPYGRGYGRMASLSRSLEVADTNSAPPVEIDPGLNTVSVTLTVDFSKKS